MRAQPSDKKTEKSKGSERRRKLERQKKRSAIEGLVAFLIVVLAIAGVAWYFISPTLSSTGNSLSDSGANSSFELIAGSPPTLGSKDAPVAIVEFGDFQCPTCGLWFRTQEQNVIRNLINTGRAKLVWRDFAFYGPDSTYASEAAYAAAEQGKFWQFHDLLYSNQRNPNDGWASKDNIRRFAQQLGLDIAKFDQSVNSGKYLPLINTNFNLGQKFGVNGTPTFLIVGSNGKIITISGAQPFSVFESAVRSLNG